MLEGGGKRSAGSVPLKVLKERSRCWREVHCEMPDGRLPERLLLERSSKKRVPQWRKMSEESALEKLLCERSSQRGASPNTSEEGKEPWRTLREMLR